MDERQSLRLKIEDTRAALTAKLTVLEDRAEAKKEAVVDSLDWRHQMRERPWTLIGIAAFTGFFFGCLTS